MLTPGQTVERYTVEAVIGQGGMAVVYRVRHNALGSLHALKILTVPKPNIRERLLAEGRAQAAIRHPNVVSVSDVLEIGNSPALLMEYVDGPTLEGWLERTTPPLDVAEELFRGICAGVGEAHRYGMVHRDLKPSNVLLAPKIAGDLNSGFIPKVTDFGIAKVLAGDDFEKKTRTNVAMGTPHYMAPEQIRDAKSVDQRADVFSLGCMLYELVCGVRPFDGNDVLMILNAVASGRYDPPRSHVPDLPDRFESAIRRALEVDRDQRLQSCQAIVTVLSGQEPVEPKSTWSPGSTAVPEPVASMPPVPAAPTSPGFETVPPAPSAASPNSAPTAGLAHAVAADVLAEADGIGKETPSLPIDPNAMTVPRPQERTASPGAERAVAFRRSLGLGLLLLTVAGGLASVLLFGYLQDPTRVPGEPHDDGAVLNLTQPAWEPILEIRAPETTDTDAAPPGVRTDPSKRPPETKVTVPKPPPGLGLFGPKEAPPAEGKGRVRITGDVKAAVYVHGLLGTPLGDADLPPGKYDVRAAFGAEPQKVALEVDLKPGEVVVVECTSAWNLCQKRN